MNEINGINPAELHTMNRPGGGKKDAKGGFADLVKDAVNEVNNLQQNANTAIEDLAVGRKRTLHETMIEVEKADVAFRMLMAVRNKAIQAYQEVMRMNF